MLSVWRVFDHLAALKRIIVRALRRDSLRTLLRELPRDDHRLTFLLTYDLLESVVRVAVEIHNAFWA